MTSSDRVIRIGVLAGKIAAASGKGKNQSGESDEWGKGLRNWRNELAMAAYELQEHAKAILEETGIKPGWILSCSEFEPKPDAYNGSCGNCVHHDDVNEKCGLREAGKSEGEEKRLPAY